MSSIIMGAVLIARSMIYITVLAIVIVVVMFAPLRFAVMQVMTLS
jgi:hypothetical protein